MNSQIKYHAVAQKYVLDHLSSNQSTHINTGAAK